MKKITILFVAFTLIFSSLVRADEGMWFLAFINKNYDQMKSMGFKLTPEDIYSINNASLKDVIVSLDHGSCTGEIVSSQGLMLTNHHCGYGEIQAHSTVENDYLTNGFWATNMTGELPNPGKTVSFLVKMEDVTPRVLSMVNDKMSEEMRAKMIEKAISEIQKEQTKGNNYEAEILSMYDGNAYYLFVYETFKDVRLVGAPPSSIGKYGGDTDNWMWPRHTGDFTIFRIYTAPDGTPAEYSPENIPLNPKKYLKISNKGVNENDFSMIMGYPGTTNRYLTSWEISQVMNNENTIRVAVRENILAIYKKHMDANPEVKIQYAAKYAQCANYWKYSDLQNVGLKNLNVEKRREKLQKQIMKWVKKTPERKAKYGEMFNIIETAVASHQKEDVAMQYWFEGIYLGAEVLQFGLKTYGLYQALSGEDADEISLASEELKKEAELFYKDYNKEVDKELFITMLNIYLKNVDPIYTATLKDVLTSYDNSVEKYADEMYSKSIFTDKNRFFEYIANPSLEILASDLGFDYTSFMITSYYDILDKKDVYDKDYTKGRRLFLDAYMKMLDEKNPGHLFYPDANSSMRITYGTVGGYTFNKVTYTYFTTIDEYIKKEDPKNEEFFVTDKMKKLYQAKDYGRWAYPDGVLRVCFLTNNDITGGNSGSPVMNGNGELIGLAFDGNSEGMSGDVAFEPALQKTICVDIKYVLWVIEKYGDAKWLIKEMDIVE